MNGVRLAVSWLTVLPVRGPDEVDRKAAGRAIGWAPVVGVLLGLGTAGVLWAIGAAGGSWLLGGFVAVAGLALITRGMHIDGLADTMDGLGSYGPPERAREIMKSGGAGPFGVAALIFVIGIQAVSFAALAEAGRWVAVVLAVVVGRVAVVLACRRGIAAAPGAGFGALVAGTQSLAVGVLWTVAAVAAGVWATGDWRGPLGVVAALGISALLVRHCVRRFGGLNGDVLGAALEVAVTVSVGIASLAV
ncbi:adenosylcobinamide-GDP ribazoletransferase [Nocardia yamanashiensis]|uniref:adenosylcobinamide-GDP ribazoletransferase n=1 Tax=Nocardia yamanashiensis TaxID=209247 RepID=UPI001E617E98|nr:adenosylcobinamide-GDP ribazoletransferase [Nocardia yamanashiensis]UGT40931.1 adenosylcobinamide-GDP ribazoletransferase [Nocardia yamanashiensis]